VPVTTFFPDANPETTSVDGVIERVVTEETWATISGAADGTGAGDLDSSHEIRILSGPTTADRWNRIARGISLFDTASLPDGDDIDSATVEFVLISPITNDFTDSLSLVLSTPASNTAIVTGDYDQLGTVKQATDVTLASLTADSATFNVMTLNATGRGNITKTGVSKFGFRMAKDDATGPTWVASKNSLITMASAEEVLAGDKRPKLVVTHTTPPFIPRAVVF